MGLGYSGAAEAHDTLTGGHIEDMAVTVVVHDPWGSCWWDIGTIAGQGEREQRLHLAVQQGRDSAEPIPRARFELHGLFSATKQILCG